MKEIKKILENLKGIDGWKIEEKEVEACELFFIRQEMDMNRRKKVRHYKVTVYKDFTADGEKYRGSSTTSIHPSMSVSDMEEALQEAVFAASFVKNKYYPLVKPVRDREQGNGEIESSFSREPLSVWLPRISRAVYGADTYQRGWINSTEFFLNRVTTRIVNSEGVDISYVNYQGEIELITNWKEEGEEVELYKQIEFADYRPEELAREVDKMLVMSREKALAQQTPSLKDIPVLLTGDPVKEFFNYYYAQANCRMVYEQISTAKLNENIQGRKIKGDRLNIRLEPILENSTRSAPYDSDGLPLEPVEIIKDGKLVSYWGDNRHSYYLGVEPTGQIDNLIVQEGSRPVQAFKDEPYLELLAFSHFQMDPVIGNFGGEIRLGRYYDGSRVVPVTGGSISGNIRDVQQEMFFSRETQQLNNFIGPATVRLTNVVIAGS